MKIKFVIIGGGVAGLSAAIRLAELGQKPLIIESGNYPAHKICGEFLSPECMKQLNCWDIHPVFIKKTTLHTANHHLIFPFLVNAGSLSHLTLDPALVKYALSLGCQFKTDSQVHLFEQKKDSKSPHLIHLSNSETIEAENVILAAGKFHTYSAAPIKCYMGFKSHFDNSDLKIDHLEMFSFPNAYLGVSPVEDNKANVACIAKISHMENINPQTFIQNLIAKNPYLNALLPVKNNLFKEWMTASIPDFGFKQTPDWQDCYFIGDAAMTIPPASGNGLSLAIFGGCLAAEHAVEQKYLEFKKIWK
ncbi:MAG TPA: NAD(P)/FAD-dependent oxidoreductase, partial [Parachlamydiaceae bacterium]|nr:NAD(P)/FAD-dependent oxidoreductase [Parachlamydiaceae bacterium]